MEIEVLYFDGCPGYERLLPVVRDLARDYDAELVARPVPTVEHSERERFLGSPSVRVNGIDVEPGAEQRTDFGFKCRLYPGNVDDQRLPARAWVEQALRTERTS